MASDMFDERFGLKMFVHIWAEKGQVINCQEYLKSDTTIEKIRFEIHRNTTLGNDGVIVEAYIAD